MEYKEEVCYYHAEALIKKLLKKKCKYNFETQL